MDIIAQFHVNFRNSVSGTGTGTGIGMVSKAEQVQEQECKKVRNRYIYRIRTATGIVTATGISQGNSFIQFFNIYMISVLFCNVFS